MGLIYVLPYLFQFAAPHIRVCIRLGDALYKPLKRNDMVRIREESEFIEVLLRLLLRLGGSDQTD